MQVQQEVGAARSSMEDTISHGTIRPQPSRTTAPLLESSEAGTDISRAGGDESKIRKHYGLTSLELASAERKPSRQHSPNLRGTALVVRTTESLEDLRELRSHPQASLEHSNLGQPLFTNPLRESTSFSRKREPKKFSIRKVFGKNDAELQNKLERDSTDLPHDLDFMLDGNETKRGMLPASQRRISIENRRYSTTTLVSTAPSNQARPASPVDPVPRIPPAFEEPFRPPPRERSSTIRTVQPADTTPRADRRIGTFSVESRPAGNAFTRPTYNPEQRPPLYGGKLQPRRSVPDAFLPSTLPPTPEKYVEQSPRRQSNDSINNSDERTPLRASAVRKRSGQLRKVSTAVDALSQSSTINASHQGSWTSATASRQAMEAASFFARLGELETRMTSVERMLAKLHRRDEQKNSQQRGSSEGTPDGKFGPGGHTNLSANGSGTPATQRYLTPPPFQATEQHHDDPDSWLDANSSCSSFDDSATTSPGQSSRTSEECEKYSPSSPLTPFSPFDMHASTTQSSPLVKKIDYSSPMFVKVDDKTGSNAVAVEVKALRSDLTGLRRDVSQPSSVFGKAAVPTFAHVFLDKVESHSQYEHVNAFNDRWDRLYSDSGRGSQNSIDTSTPRTNVMMPERRLTGRRSMPFQSNTTSAIGIVL